MKSGGKKAGAMVKQLAKQLDIPPSSAMMTLADVTDERQHSGESIAATVEALWKLRTAALRLLAALDKLDEGCREPGFRGWENGDGVRCGDEAERARKALARLVRGPNAECRRDQRP